MAGNHDPNAKVPFMQQLLDSPFVLMAIGVLLPMAVYTVWGIIDVLMIPVAK